MSPSDMMDGVWACAEKSVGSGLGVQQVLPWPGMMGLICGAEIT